MHTTRCIALLIVSLLVLVATPASGSTAAATATSFGIYWTAPGDDGPFGRALAYDLRYSSTPITAANFHLAQWVSGVPAPAIAGTLESFVVTGIPVGTIVYMAIKSADDAGNWSSLSNIVTQTVVPTGLGGPALALSFSSPWPNPARQSARWSYALPRAAQVQVDVFDVSGRNMHTVASGEREAGRGELTWDLRDDRGQPVGAGIYYVKARLGTMEWKQRLVVVR